MNMPYLINRRAFSPSVILSEAKDLTPALYLTHCACVTSASIVRFLAPLGMTTERARPTNFDPATKQ